MWIIQCITLKLALGGNLGKLTWKVLPKANFKESNGSTENFKKRKIITVLKNCGGVQSLGEVCAMNILLIHVQSNAIISYEPFKAMLHFDTN